MKYEKLKKQFKTGDIILFEGNGFFSQLVKCCSNSEFSHIGIIVKGEDIPKYTKKKEKFYLLHSNKSSVPIKDIISNDNVSGVQINDLKENLESYNGFLYYRELLRKDGTSVNFINIEKYIEKIADKPYEVNYLEMLFAVFDGNSCCLNSENLNSLFCSELVAYIYLKYHILRNDLPSNEYIPSDFSYDNWKEYFNEKYILKKQIPITF
jgi:hypothetical protein